MIRAAAGALSCGGLLFALARTTGQDVRHLERLPVIRELADIHHIEKNGGLDGRPIAATGIVTSKETLQDTLSKQTALAALVKGVELNKTRVRHGWESGERPIKEIRRCVPLDLELKDKETLELKPSDPREVGPVLEHSVTISHPPSGHLLQALVETSLGYMVTGTADTEYILPPNTKVTAIGEVSKGCGHQGRYALNPHGGQLLLSRQSLDQQIKSLERWTSALKTAALVLGATGVLCTTAVLAMKGYRYFQRKKKRKNEEAFLQRAAERRQAVEQGRESRERNNRHEWYCTVCWEKDVDQTVFPACGHIAACKNCSAHLTRCPICRQASRPRQIFYS